MADVSDFARNVFLYFIPSLLSLHEFIVDTRDYQFFCHIFKCLNIRRKFDNSTRILYGIGTNNPLDVFEQAINKNSEIVAITNHNLADFELHSMVPEQYSFSHAPSGWKDGSHAIAASCTNIRKSCFSF